MVNESNLGPVENSRQTKTCATRAGASQAQSKEKFPKLVDKHSHVKEEKEVYEESRLQAAKPANETIDLTNSSGDNDIDAGYVAITKVM